MRQRRYYYNPEYYRRRYLENRERILARHKQYRAANKDKINRTRQQWREKNPDLERAMNARFRVRHHAELIEKGRQRYQANPDKHRAVRRASYWKNRQRERAYNIDYSKRNRSKIIAQRRLREQSDPQCAIGERLRRHLVKAILRRNTQKTESTFALVGCSLPDLVKHIESQFVNGMNWENRRQWHVDHHVPVAAFDLSDAEEQRWAYHFKNLRPLFARDNHQKSDEIPNPLPQWLPTHIAERILTRVTLKAKSKT